MVAKDLVSVGNGDPQIHLFVGHDTELTRGDVGRETREWFVVLCEGDGESRGGGFKKDIAVGGGECGEVVVFVGLGESKRREE